MGWANCGEDSKGRPIGYAVEATCDHPGCDKKIDRGLGHACGQNHGAVEESCEGYFCEDHLRTVISNNDYPHLCFACCEAIEKEEKEFGDGSETEEETDTCEEANPEDPKGSRGRDPEDRESGGS